MRTRRLLQAAFLIALLVMVFPGGPAPSGVVASASPGPDEDGGSDIRINEVMFHPDTGQHEWVELKNAGSGGVDISGYGITDEDDNWYRIPDALPEVPAGGFVVILFDGAGSSGDDTDFADNVATLHSPSGLVDIFEDDADQCALYDHVASDLLYVSLPLVLQEYAGWNPHVPGVPVPLPISPLVAFVGWGEDPGDDASEATTAGVWREEWHVGLYRGTGKISASAMSGPDESIGLLPGSETAYPDDWTLYQSGEVTQGAKNEVPAISWSYPSSGATVDGETFAISWGLVSEAVGYRFQMDDDSGFSSPMVNTTLTEPAYIPTSTVAEGIYYWRVRVIYEDGQSSWSPGAEINVLHLPAGRARGTQVIQLSQEVLGVTWQMQHKDTCMLCLDGDKERGAYAWDRSHTLISIHARNYCVRATISMLASYYGGTLSQDRISYEIFRKDPPDGPEGDLGHDKAVGPVPQKAALKWALGTENITEVNGKPTFGQIKEWIIAERPIIADTPGHSRVIDGYVEYTIVVAPPFPSITYQWVHLLDPSTKAQFVLYDSDNVDYVLVGPAKPTGAPGVKSDPDEDGDGVVDTTLDDSDGDGICDFDERHRFSANGRSLDPDYPDSDFDNVPDKEDIRGYVFGEDSEDMAIFSPDADGDGHRKELDPDNDKRDDDGLPDGCEDGNYNGKFDEDLGETSCFDAHDDVGIWARLTWPEAGADVDLHLIRPGGSLNGSGDCYFGNGNPDWGESIVDCDDPTLDVDCITGCTVENIRLGKPETGTYNIMVHYYSDHGLGPANPSVTLEVASPSPLFGGEPSRYPFPAKQLEDGQVWHVGTVEWPSGRVTLIGTVN